MSIRNSVGTLDTADPVLVKHVARIQNAIDDLKQALNRAEESLHGRFIFVPKLDDALAKAKSCMANLAVRRRRLTDFVLVKRGRIALTDATYDPSEEGQES